MHIELWQVQRNLEHAGEFVTRAAKAGVELLLFPELFATGFPAGDDSETAQDKQKQFAEPLEGQVVCWLLDQARQSGMFIAGTVLEEDEAVYNTAVLATPQGDIGGIFRKIHTMGIHQPGHEIPVWETPLARLGCMICYDHRFPEVARIAALKGAEIILHPTNCGGCTDPLYDKNLTIRARAIENGCYVVVANRAQEPGVVGNSQVCGPYTDKAHRNDIVLAMASDWEDLIIAELTSDRYSGPPPDRRPECYRELLEL